MNDKPEMKLVPVEPTDDIKNIQEEGRKAFEDLFNLNTKEGYPLIRLRPEVNVTEHVEAFRELQFLPYKLTKDAPTVQEVDLELLHQNPKLTDANYDYQCGFLDAIIEFKKYGKIYAVK